MKRYAGVLGFFVFLLVSLNVLQLPVERLGRMFGPLGRMVTQRLLPPDIAYLADYTIVEATLVTLEMSFVGALVGTLVSVPVAWLGAWNVSPNRYFCYPLGRGILALSRAVPTLIWAMLLVVVLGFGPLPGIIALALETIGFAGKLFSEEVEAINMGPVDAIRATGANDLQVFVYGVFPQVKAAWAGIAIYNWDSVFRASTVLGFVGAGGLGLYLRMTTQEMEYQRAMGIITLTIALVLFSEIVSNHVRHKLY
ncbi:MAG: phosphonate ABC transporter, permease protein PhnE [Candidatus Methylomirabilia bacterium]